LNFHQTFSIYLRPILGFFLTTALHLPFPPTPTLQKVFLDKEITINGVPYETLSQAVHQSASLMGVDPAIATWMGQIMEYISKAYSVSVYDTVGEKMYEHKETILGDMRELEEEMDQNKQYTSGVEDRVHSNARITRAMFEEQEEKIRVQEQVINDLKRDMNSHTTAHSGQINELYSHLNKLLQGQQKLNRNIVVMAEAMKTLRNENVDLKTKLEQVRVQPAFAPLPPPSFVVPPAPQFIPTLPQSVPTFMQPQPPVAMPAPPFGLTPSPIARPPAPIPKMSTPEPFTGDKKDITFDNWVTKMELYFNHYRMTDDRMRITDAIMNLGPKPMAYMECVSSALAAGQPVYTWNEFVAELGQNYRALLPKKEAQVELEKLCKRKFSRVNDWVADFRKFATKSGFLDEDLISRIDNLRSNKLTEQVGVVRGINAQAIPTTWSAYLTWLQHLEEQSAHEKHTKPSDAMDIDAMTERIKPTPIPMNDEQKEWFKKGSCFRCGKHKYSRTDKCRSPKYKGWYEIPKREVTPAPAQQKIRVVEESDSDGDKAAPASEKIAAVQVEKDFRLDLL
jgi:hypothetical protein